jgi:hypothetical protein
VKRRFLDIWVTKQLMPRADLCLDTNAFLKEPTLSWPDLEPALQ